jgi:hypothetical protein
MALNPELRRYCWLELTPHRLIATPLIIGLIVALVAATTDAPAEPLAMTGLIGFAIGAALFGSYFALSAVTEEVRERTWDTQRMSALTPSAFAFGKIFGAPVYGWYAGAWFLALYLFTGPRVHGSDAVLIAAAAVCSTVALHATSVLMSAVIARAGITRNTAPGFLILILWSGALPWHMFEAGKGPLTWWGLALPQLWFVLVSAALFAGWALLGAARTFATELRVRQLPWAWPAFCLYIAVWGGGLIEAKTGGRANAAALVTLLFFLATGVGAYLMLLTERIGAMTVARVLRTLRGDLEGGVHRALQETPIWPVSLVCAWAAGVLLLVLPWSSGGAALLNEIAGQGKVMPLALAAMLLRDAGIYCIFALARFPRRAATVTLVYVALLDAVLPLLMGAAGMETLAFVVFPLGRASAPGALVIFLVQAAIAWTIAVARWRAAQKLDLKT